MSPIIRLSGLIHRAILDWWSRASDPRLVPASFPLEHTDLIYSLDVALSGKGSARRCGRREERGEGGGERGAAPLDALEKASAVRLAGASEDSGGGVNRRSGFVRDRCH